MNQIARRGGACGLRRDVRDDLADRPEAARHGWRHGEAEDVDRAAKAAKAAFREWAAMPGKERKALLHEIADAIVARAEEIAFVECMDTGQALRFMSKAALRGAENFRFFADRAPEARDGRVAAGAGASSTSPRARRSVRSAIITPWNTPFMLSTWKIAPALAAGCTIVHKPAEFSPLTARLLVEIAEEAGLPKGVWNLVNGFGEGAGKALTEHRDIKAIGFVGESRTGSLIMKQGADTLKRVHFELGGKNPVIVFADADLDRAADAAVFMIYSLNGERCTSSSRLLVEESVHDAFVASVAEKASRIRVGHPLDPDTVVGPLIHPEHEKKVLSYFDVARRGGRDDRRRRREGRGAGRRLLRQADAVCQCAASRCGSRARRSSGPFSPPCPSANEEEALALANDVDYGLAGYLWTSDVTRAFRFTEALEAGMIWVNSENVRHLPTPFGGVKSSGIGRDGGDWSFDFYMETKNIAFATEAAWHLRSSDG